MIDFDNDNYTGSVVVTNIDEADNSLCSALWMVEMEVWVTF